MASDSKKQDSSFIRRRKPQRPHGERRVSELLDAAAAVIAERGYESATMTEIAQRAGASIGTIYQYFPDKGSLAMALRERYGKELGKVWSEFLEEAANLSIDHLVNRLMEIMIAFTTERPAYFPVLNVTTSYRRDPAARTRLRQLLAVLLQKKAPQLEGSDAYRIANVLFEVIKSINPLLVDASPKERKKLEAEFTLLLSTYLTVRLREGMP